MSSFILGALLVCRWCFKSWLLFGSASQTRQVITSLHSASFRWKVWDPVSIIPPISGSIIYLFWQRRMLNIITIRVSKMTSHCGGAVQMREESESGIRKWEEMWFKTTAEDGERGGQQWRAMKDCSTDERLQQEMLRVETSTSNVQRRWWGITYYSRCLASVSAGRRSASNRYVGARPCWHFVRQHSNLIGAPLRNLQPVNWVKSAVYKLLTMLLYQQDQVHYRSYISESFATLF